MDHWMKPMLCAQGVEGMTFSGVEWVGEGKWDGWRAIVYRDPEGAVRLYSGRNSADYTGHLPYLDEALGAFLPPDTCLDGELLSPRGRSAVQSAMFTDQAHRPSSGLPALTLVAFDVIRSVGTDVRREPWTTRRGLLERLFSQPYDEKLLSLSMLLPSSSALEVALAAGLEGVVMKRRSSSYMNSRSSNWVKLKPQQTCEAKVIGFKPGKAGGAWDGKVGAFEVELLDGDDKPTGVKTTVKCGTDACHIEATQHPERWLGAIIEIRHHGIQPSGVPLHPQNGGKRGDKMPRQQPKERRPPVASTAPWMRNYGQMKDEKLDRCIAELEAREGDAYDRVRAHNASVDEHLDAARAVRDQRRVTA